MLKLSAISSYAYTPGLLGLGQGKRGCKRPVTKLLWEPLVHYRCLDRVNNFHSASCVKSVVYKDHTYRSYCIVLFCIVLYCFVLFCIVLYYIALYTVRQQAIDSKQ